MIIAIIGMVLYVVAMGCFLWWAMPVEEKRSKNVKSL